MDCWTLQVDCECISKKVTTCTGRCCQVVTKAVGVVMVLGGGESEGTAFAELAALTASWELKLDAPWKTPQRAPHEYLPAIFTSVLKNTLPWQRPGCLRFSAGPRGSKWPSFPGPRGGRLCGHYTGRCKKRTAPPLTPYQQPSKYCTTSHTTCQPNGAWSLRSLPGGWTIMLSGLGQRTVHGNSHPS